MQPMVPHHGQVQADRYDQHRVAGQPAPHANVHVSEGCRSNKALARAEDTSYKTRVIKPNEAPTLKSRQLQQFKALALLLQRSTSGASSRRRRGVCKQGTAADKVNSQPKAGPKQGTVPGAPADKPAIEA